MSHYIAMIHNCLSSQNHHHSSSLSSDAAVSQVKEDMLGELNMSHRLASRRDPVVMGGLSRRGDASSGLEMNEMFTSILQSHSRSHCSTHR